MNDHAGRNVVRAAENPTLIVGIGPCFGRSGLVITRFVVYDVVAAYGMVAGLPSGFSVGAGLRAGPVMES